MSPSWCASICNEVSLIHVSNGYHCKIEFTKFKLGDPKNLLLQWLLSSTLNLVGDLKHLLLSSIETQEGAIAICCSQAGSQKNFALALSCPQVDLVVAMGCPQLCLHLHWADLKLVCTCICCSHTDQSGPVSLPLSLMQGRQCLTALPSHALHLGI